MWVNQDIVSPDPDNMAVFFFFFLVPRLPAALPIMHVFNCVSVWSVCEHTCMVQVWRSEDSFCGVSSLLQLLLGFWESNSGHQICIVSSFTAHPYHQCHHVLPVYPSVCSPCCGHLLSSLASEIFCFSHFPLLPSDFVASTELTVHTQCCRSCLKENELAHVLSLQGTASLH